jgi:adenylate cyclase
MLAMLKKISPVVVVGLLLTAACVCLYSWRPPFITDISNRAYDLILKYNAEPQKSDSAVIVDLDERSLKEVGQWPWSRYIVAQLALKIMEDNASVVVFDVIFAERDRTSPCNMEQDINKRFKDLNVKISGLPEDGSLNDFDANFAEVLGAGSSVLGCYMYRSSEQAPDTATTDDNSYKGHIQLRGRKLGVNINDFIMQADRILVSIPELNSKSSAAFINAEPDNDNIVRNPPLFIAFGSQRIYPALALEALRLHLNAEKCIVDYDESGIEQVRIPPDVYIPVDRAGRFAVNFRTLRESANSVASSSFPTYSAVDVVRGKFTPGTFSNKIVFVGTSAVGLNDNKATPICPYFPGVEVHATIIDNVLAGDMLWNPAWMPSVHWSVIIIVGIFLTILISRGRSWISFLVSVLVILLSISASLVMIRRYHLIFHPTWIILSVIIIYTLLTMIKFWQEELQKKQVRDMFGTMVSADVLHYLENNPGSFSLSGTKAEATMFFSDIRGFTTISESLPAGKLSVFLNRYLSPMTDIIMERRGYVDKYEGDLIMAVWGVPYPMKDHAVQACLAAIEQQEKLAAIRPILRAEFGHDIHVRMGINSGTVTAGNMGSDKKFQYTVIGDAVNQAARFEPVNKDYGTLIVVGETTYEEAKDFVEARLLDRIVVQGKTQPIRLYELLARKGSLPPAKMKVVRFYETALQAHWERKWDEAIACLDAGLELDSQDTPSIRLRERVSAYKQTPPPDAWAGEYVRASKD